MSRAPNQTVESSIKGRVVQGRGDLAEAAAVGLLLFALDDDVRLVVLERGEDLVGGEDLTRSHGLGAYGVRGDAQVLYPLRALVAAQRVVGPVGADPLGRLELLGLCG